jgi:catalase
MAEDKKALLIETTVRNIMPVTENIKYRHAVHCCKADPDYGKRFSDGCKLDWNKVQELAKLDEKAMIAETLN